MTMICVWADLAVASDKLKGEADPIAASLFLELTTATALAKAYDNIWHSIYWNKARATTKRRVEATLSKIAYSVADHLKKAIALFNEYCDLPHEQPITQEWLEIRTSLWLVNKTLTEYYSWQTKHKQLEIPGLWN